MTLTLVLGLLAGTVPLPYAGVAGRAIPVTDVLSVQPLRDHGESLLLIANSEPLTTIGMVRTWFDPDVAIERRSSVAESPAARAAGQRRLRDSIGSARQVVADHLGSLAPIVAFDADMGDLGGPSAGLAFAIAATDMLSDGDLTGGRVVAATGELLPTGEIVAVGRVSEKARAAARAGADLLLVPVANVHEAAEAAPRLRVVGVATFHDTIAMLSGADAAEGESAR